MAIQKNFFLRFFYSMFILLLLYDLIGHALFAAFPTIAHPWHNEIACAFLFYEIALAIIYAYVDSESPMASVAVILGSKVIKILFALIVLMFYWRFANGPIKPFVVDLLITYFITMICESGFLIAENKKAAAKNAETDIK